MLIDFKLLQGTEDLHLYLGCEPRVADLLLRAPDSELFNHHLIPKKGGRGGTREVWEVCTDEVGDLYKGLARKLDDFIRSSLPGFPHGSVHGYVQDRSTWTNAMAHIGADKILKADIKSFFRSIGKHKVVGLLERLGLSSQAAQVLASIVVRDDHLPLGLPTSPLLANAICHDMDGRLAALVHGGRYTRYADDLSFSGPALPTKAAIEAELRRESFQLAEAKWRLVRAGRGLYVTGLSLEDRRQARVPKGMKRRLRQDLHHAKRHGLDHHLGIRGYATAQSGINKIDGLIRYIRGIEPRLGRAYHEEWIQILKESELQVSYPQQGAVVGRKITFVVDESVLERPSGSVMVVALVVIEDLDLVRRRLGDVLNELAVDPFGATGKAFLSKKGLHWNDLAPDDRTTVTERMRSLLFRCFVAFTTLPGEDRKTYSDAYRRLLMKLVEGRLVHYDRSKVEVILEENTKVDQSGVSAAITEVYEGLGSAKSRRPVVVPTIRVAAKLSEPALALPDIVMGIFGDFARSEFVRSEEAGRKKKRQSGDQADKRFEQIRDKIRAIFDLDSGDVFSRRNSFRPWNPADS